MSIEQQKNNDESTWERVLKTELDERDLKIKTQFDDVMNGMLNMRTEILSLIRGIARDPHYMDDIAPKM